MKYTNHIRELLLAYRKGYLPKSWKSFYVTIDSVTFLSWLEELAQRLHFFLQLFSSSSATAVSTASSSSVTEITQCITTSFSSIAFDLQKMRYADSLLMASRQQMARLHHWSLEEMELFLDVSDGGGGLFDAAAQDLCVVGLFFQGAKYDSVEKAFLFSEELQESIPKAYLKWRLKASIVRRQSSSASTDLLAVPRDYEEVQKQAVIKVPIYYNDHRRSLMYSVYVPVVANQTNTFIPPSQWAQRSVAIVFQTSMQ